MARLLLVTVTSLICAGYCYGSKYLGCYKDDSNRLFSNKIYQGSALTTEKCVQMCSINGYKYAGTQNANQCFCGNDLNAAYSKKPTHECNKACTGDSSQKCGGYWRMSVYRANNYRGCYKDASTRILPAHKTSSPEMTTQKCLDFCKNANYKLAGTQNGGQCFCDNRLREAYPKKSDSECNKDCNGSIGETCGGFWRVAVYRT